LYCTTVSSAGSRSGGGGSDSARELTHTVTVARECGRGSGDHEAQRPPELGEEVGHRASPALLCMLGPSVLPTLLS
jgi:hypothetical protein